eukprot:3793399-Prymnesium_polylepis.1
MRGSEYAVGCSEAAETARRNAAALSPERHALVLPTDAALPTMDWWSAPSIAPSDSWGDLKSLIPLGVAFLTGELLASKT